MTRDAEEKGNQTFYITMLLSISHKKPWFRISPGAVFGPHLWKGFTFWNHNFHLRDIIDQNVGSHSGEYLSQVSQYANYYSF